MSGNVWEWISSLYARYPYDVADKREPDTGDRTDVRRMVRGGSWGVNSDVLRAPNREWSDPAFRINYFGFRCARSYE